MDVLFPWYGTTHLVKAAWELVSHQNGGQGGQLMHVHVKPKQATQSNCKSTQPERSA